MQKQATLIGFLAFAWLIFVSLYYVYTHKPFNPGIAVALGLAVWRLTLAAIILAGAGGLGRALVQRWADNPLLQLALGLGLLSIFILLATGLGQISTTSLGIGLGVIILANIKNVLGFGLSAKNQLEQLIPANGIPRWIALLSLSIAVLNLPYAFNEPIQFDTLVYHLTLPEEYLRAGRLVFVPEIMFWGMPQLTEMLYLLAIALGGPPAALTFSWILSLVTLLGMIRWLTQRFGQTAAWVGGASMMAGFTISGSISWGYVEWMLILYGLCWLISLEEWVSTRRESWIWLAAGLAGMSLGIKYTAGLLALIQVLLVAGWKEQQLQDRFRLTLGGGLIIVLVSSPWWIKNFLFTGNPFYPLLFETPWMDALRLDFYQTVPPSHSLWDTILLPWYVTMWGVDGLKGPSATIGPLLLGFGGLAWVGWQRRSQDQKRLIQVAGAVCLLGYICWAIASQRSIYMIQTRLFMNLFPAWVVLASAGYDGLDTLRAGNIRFGRIGLSFVLLFVFFNFLETTSTLFSSRALEANLGLISQQDYLYNHNQSYAAINQEIAKLPPDSKAVMLWETRSYACRPICDPDEIIDRWYHDRRMYQTAEGILDAWKKQGYTHLVLSNAGANFVETEDNFKFESRDWQELGRLRQLLKDKILFDNVYTIYQLK